ncbi:MAG: hypothetical protein IJ358_03380 [Clostridia bacterium]|nr:hypothetical protein [Clostridia bacterium]
MKIDIRKRYSFKYYDSLIAYMIDNNYDLEHGDLWHIFNNMPATKSSKYNNLGSAIIYLLDELKYEKRNRLVELLNKCFDYKRIDVNRYKYNCKNKLVSKYLINLETQLRNHNLESDEEDAFEDFKSLF